MSLQPQPGIFAFGTIEHCYVEFDLAPNREPRDLASALAALHGPGTPLVATNAVVGLRPELWASVAPDAALSGVRSFGGIEARDFSMPATQHDAWIWTAGASRDIVFDSTLAAIRSLDGVAAVATEVTGFGYQRNRDLTGFIDGTENPSTVEAPGVAVEQDGPGAGAAVLLVQQWEHLTSFANLSTKEQEGVIGRTKDKSIQLEDDEMPIDSHVARNVVEEDGEELAIYRRNTAWGGPTYHGTMFVGFCRSQHPLQIMLERMAGLPDGTRDALTRYSVPITGAYYVVPSLNALLGLLPPEVFEG
jgi:putative iron-dependent peroxidase